MKLTVRGARGSVPVAGAAFATYGGQTSCYQLDIGGKQIYLDAGSGIIPASFDVAKSTYILLSHLHLDHIQGLPFFSGLTHGESRIHIYGNVGDGAEYSGIQEAINTAFGKPFWPLTIDEYPATVDWQDIRVGDCLTFEPNVEVTTMASNHPGGSIIYGIRAEGYYVVYATDFEHGSAKDEELIEFARDCDVLIYDGQYTREEYKKFQGYGHSTKERGLEILEACGGRQILFSHYHTTHTDAFLAEEEKRLVAMDGRVRFAKVGEVIDFP
ncbi:MAG: MBL fold metallo-hydrolase [Lachnospiraceae bacterium]|nr:MBL fold metallo-hydrolase [Lachnospiraceae bacterium]